MAWEYSEKTKQLFMDAVHGKPGTHLGEIEDPDGFGEHGSIACGDAMRFTFRVKRHPTDPTQDVITDARYLTFGCTSAIAASEALCTMIEQGGYTPIQALEDAEQRHRRVSRRPAAAEDPLFGDGRRGPGSGRLQLGPEARRGSGAAGHRHPRRRAAGRPHRLQVLFA